MWREQQQYPPRQDPEAIRLESLQGGPVDNQSRLHQDKIFATVTVTMSRRDSEYLSIRCS